MSDFDTDAFMQNYYAQREQYQKSAAIKFRHACEHLRAAGVAKVICHYSGYGDSGGVEDVYYYTADDSPVARGDLPDDSDIREYAESLLPAGFEINDGGQGEVHFDLLAGTYSVHHEQNRTEVDVDEYEGEF